jgi:hypothetical protein
MTSPFVIAVGLTLAGVDASSAQERMLSMECAFDRVCSRAEGCRDQDVEIDVSFDPVAGFGLMDGPLGTSIVEVITGQDRRGTEVISFFGRLASGAIQSTSITQNGDAVHSYHAVVAGGMMSTQSYGSCIVEAWW